jgi:ubiquinone/menaquinone biosynthesis C-methylase UbiE
MSRSTRRIPRVAWPTTGWVLGAVVALAACQPRAERVTTAGGGSGIAVGADTVLALEAPGAPARAFPAPAREVADIVAPRWTAEDDRDEAGEFETVVRLAGIARGQAVADIGAGDGYYVARLSPLVGDSGRVFGQDIVPDYLALLQRRVTRDRLTNVRVVLREAHDPRLPANSVDVALMIHMYHEIAQPFALLWNLATAMRPGGRLVILDLERPTYGHGTPPALLQCELASVGYRRESFTRTGPEEYVTIYTAPSATERPTPDSVTARLRRSPCRTR